MFRYRLFSAMGGNEGEVELAERAGHARPSMSLDVYSHVMPPDEVPSERFRALIGR